MEESILTTIKKMIGLTEYDTIFDPDIIVYINSAFMDLYQIGVSESPFSISDKSSKWEDFLEDLTKIGYVKTYIFIKVRLIFDPPQTSFLLEALSRQLEQIEWRLNAQAETEVL